MTAVWWILGAAATGVGLSWLLPGFRAGVWSPAPLDVVQTMLELAEPEPGEHLVDLGYGDGRVLIMAAQRFGLVATGYDINPFWHWWVGARVRSLGLGDRIRLHRSDLFDADLTGADIVFAFLSQPAHDRLCPKLKTELRPGARVVTYQRTLPGWDHALEREVRPGKKVYLFRM